MFCSPAGLDSSAIAAIASGVYHKERGEKIRTFSIDYVDNDKNFRPNAFQPNPDAPWVKTVSDYLGTLHENCLIDTPELTEALFPAVLARDLPGMADIDSSLLLFSRWIKGAGHRRPVRRMCRRGFRRVSLVL